MKIREVISVLEAFAAPQLQEVYDNCGLLTGDASWVCRGVLCTLDVTEAVLKEALDNNCNMVVAHHPIIFKGLKKLTGKTYVERIVIAAIKADIAIYAIHTNLDNIIHGVNGRIAQKLNLQHITTLQPKKEILRKLITYAPTDKANEVVEALFRAGAGYIGNYSECSFTSEGVGTFKAEAGANPYIGDMGKRHYEPETKIEVVYPFYQEAHILNALIASHPYEEVAYDLFSMENSYSNIGTGIIGELKEAIAAEDLLKTLKSTFNCGIIRHTKLSGKPVKKIAVCGGAGSFLISTALQQQADFYITSDIKYHEFFDADEKMILADIGHYESEQFTIDLLYDLLLQKFTTFAVLKTKVSTNPVHYF